MFSAGLGIGCDVPERGEIELRSFLDRELPEWLDHLHMRNLRVGKSHVGLDFTRRGERTFCNVVDIEGDKLLVNVITKK